MGSRDEQGAVEEATKEAEEKTRQAEERVKQSEEETRQAEEKIRQTKEQAKQDVEKTTIEIVRNLHKRGVSIPDITASTGLSSQQVSKIVKAEDGVA